MSFHRPFLIVITFVLLALNIEGQTGVSAVSGTVADAQGQAVAGAAVKLISVGQGGERLVAAGADERQSISHGEQSNPIEPGATHHPPKGVAPG
jgi:hypothetical protein